MIYRCLVEVEFCERPDLLSGIDQSDAVIIHGYHSHMVFVVLVPSDSD